MAGPIGDDGRVQLTVETEARDMAQLRISVFGRRTDEKCRWMLNMPPVQVACWVELPNFGRTFANKKPLSVRITA